MPFMPEMLAFCGKRLQVYKRAHKTCDTVFPVRGRRVHQAVHLNTRCDGSAHGGCQAGCLLFWKEAWLKPLGKSVLKNNAAGTSAPEMKVYPFSFRECSEDVIYAQTQTISADGEPTYTCQATQLPYASGDLEWWDIHQYIEDYTSGNTSSWQILCGAAYFIFLRLQKSSFQAGRLIRWVWDRFYKLWGGAPFPRRQGVIPRGERTPSQKLDLQPGELVRIKPYKEILNTLDMDNRNRGLYFDAEEVPFCGGKYRVEKIVNKIINERTGKMLDMRSPCIVLESVVCQARYSECRMFCPRAIYSYWKETWLERVEPHPKPPKKEAEGEPMSISGVTAGSGGAR